MKFSFRYFGLIACLCRLNKCIDHINPMVAKDYCTLGLFLSTVFGTKLQSTTVTYKMDIKRLNRLSKYSLICIFIS